jgi:PTH1 family peptidyl-tRNA hydrolase
MKLIIGLGNPGAKYKNTRHNVGFLVLDHLAQKLGVSFAGKEKFSSELAETKTEQEKLILAKPATFMNESGEAASAIKSFFQIEDTDLIVVHDEVDLSFGQMKMSVSSGSAGHRGVESVIRAIGKDFARLRIGIDNRKDRKIHPTDSYVMAEFTDEETKKLGDEIVPEAVEKIEEWVKNNS